MCKHGEIYSFCLGCQTECQWEIEILFPRSHFPLLTFHFSLIFSTCFSLLASHFSLLVSRFSLSTSLFLLFISRFSFFTSRFSLFISRFSISKNFAREERVYLLELHIHTKTYNRIFLSSPVSGIFGILIGSWTTDPASWFSSNLTRWYNRE